MDNAKKKRKASRQNYQRNAWKRTTKTHFEEIDYKIEQKCKKIRVQAAKDGQLHAALTKPSETAVGTGHNGGAMTIPCDRGCGAMHFARESTRNICCDKNGRSSHEFLSEMPDFMATLLQDKSFKQNIRQYNCTFQVSTLGSTLGEDGFAVAQTFPFNIRVHGSLYHSIPPVVPMNGQQARFAQLYVIDNALNEIMRRGSSFTGIDRGVADQILNYLRENNPWVQAIRTNVRRYFHGESQPKTVQLNIEESTGQFSAPTVDEIAGFVPNDSTSFESCRSVRLHNANGTFSSINEFNPMYDPSHYVMMFPNGEPGYSYLGPSTTTALKFYQQRVQVRPGKTLGHFGRLFHEYVIDQYCKIEKARLDYMRRNQKDLRFSTRQDERPEETPVGQNEGTSYVYLPPSFMGSKRYYRRKYLDALNAVNEIGGASFFITMTTNPNWPEITENLGPHETAADRPDLVARVFKLKYDALLEDLVKKHALGICIGFLAVAEFQKRGLPHGHLLLIISPHDRPMTPEDVDKSVSAELPDKAINPDLYALVIKHMLHGPCRLYCLNAEGKCRFHYPQESREFTTWDGESMVKYRRRQNDNCFIGSRGKIFTNQHVVPYCPFLLSKYKCHLNVLVCTTKVASIRYLFDYALKGADMATVKMSLEAGENEIDAYLSGRYISAAEAIWRIFSFSMVSVSPPTLRLPVHLKNESFHVIGQPGEQRRQPKRSQLEAFFLLNRERKNDPSDAFALKYTKLSRYFIWDDAKQIWKYRKHITAGGTGVLFNRMDNISVNQGETYYLRVLLQRVSNPLSFEDVRTIQGVVYPTFQDTCREMGILQDDKTWENTIGEAIRVLSPHIARNVFAQVLAYGQVQDPKTLFVNNVADLAEDFRRREDTTGVTPSMERNTVLDIERHLNKMRRSLWNFAPLRYLLMDKKLFRPTVVIREEYNRTEKDLFLASFQECKTKANTEQRTALDMLVNAFNNEVPVRQFLLMAAAGTGKTFVQGAFINYVRAHTGNNVSFISMSTTAISAQLLPDGRTAHSTLKLPIEIYNGIARSSLAFDSPQAQQLREAKVLIWDEIFGARKELIEAGNIFFQGLHNNNKPFGDIIIVCSGDLRQTLPKLQHGQRASIVSSCFTRSTCFPSFVHLPLTENMRLQTSVNQEFAAYLLKVGNGTLEQNSTDNSIELPSYITTTSDIDELVIFVYGRNLELLTSEDLSSRAIISPLNINVRKINESILDRLRSDARDYFSTDDELDGEGNVINDLPMEVLNKMMRSGLPPYQLRLKPKAVVMCLRNLTREVCNGTKLQVQVLHNHLIDCLILTGPSRGKVVTIPRITLIDKKAVEQVILRRKQFPLALAYAMTIDKSQGQSLERVGIALDTQCFAHGQLYTALSRACNPTNLAVYQPESAVMAMKVRNIVWKEVFPKQTGTS